MTDQTSPMPPDQPANQTEVPPHTPDPAIAADPSPAMPPQGTTLAGAPSPAKRSTVTPWAVGGIALVIALGIGGAVVATTGDDPKPAAGAMTSASPSTIAPTTIAPTTAAPTTATPTSAAPSPTKTTPPPKPKPPSYKTLSARQWKLIAKNPDAHLGEYYVVYGRVTQFDAATGTDTFRADIAHRRMPEKYDYETNTMLSGSESGLANLVEDDIFRAKVMVLGSYSYDTQIGGSTTVPLLRVDSIKVL
ncbi:hypothetical protein GA0074695_3904 [Micromonospora viridifaciens]|uniref:tRNA_anti-like n=1 Tax=Micromonospora viridifaciens TaxID=1881 RepID=A0A1C4Y6L0_MICVI|nr:hypothetical protein [Micromonospora viridifaciens]SCF16342.1 hypothetical protein GA0074695_3904 [Micromonospora viridifaciens]